MKVRLAFDRTGSEITIPPDVSARVLNPRFAAVLPDAAASIVAAIDDPIGTAPLETLARGKRSAAISVCDITRPAPNAIVLPPLLAALERAGVPREGIQILIATGLHREATALELDEILGPEIHANYEVASHRAREESEHSYLGETASGTPVYIDRRFVEADLHITLGFVEPHLMAGFSGGRKLVSIGLAGEKTIKRLHSPLFMRDPRATEGSFPGNPLHQELLEIASLAGHDFMIDVALTRERGIAAVFTGEPRGAHAEAVEFVRESTLAGIEEPADAVITTSGGYPLDLTFYQAVKGVTAASHIVKPGGTILLVAACREGFGGPEFRGLMRRSPDARTLLDDLSQAPVAIDQWQAEKLALVASKARLMFSVPGVPPEDQSQLWGPAFQSPQEAVDHLTGSLAPGASLVVIPEGPYVFSRIEPVPVA